MHLAGGETPECEVGGEFGGETGAEHAVAGFFVGAHDAGCYEVGEARVGGAFAAAEGVSSFCASGI